MKLIPIQFNLGLFIVVSHEPIQCVLNAVLSALSLALEIKIRLTAGSFRQARRLLRGMHFRDWGREWKRRLTMENYVSSRLNVKTWYREN